MAGVWLVLFVVQWAILLVLALVLLGVLRYLARIQERIDLAAPHISAFELGEPLADFRLPTSDGRDFSLSDLRSRERPSLLLLLTPSCGSCKVLMAQLKELADRRPAWDASNTDVVLISGGADLDHEAVQALTNNGGLVLLDLEGAVFSRFGIRGLPTGLSVDARGLVSDQSANPHAGNWLYRKLGVAPPAQAISSGWGAMILPRAEMVGPRNMRAPITAMGETGGSGHVSSD
jgi:peroxiredoxin